MKTPVIIPARNEAEYISRTLNALPHSVEPIVVANACEDKTVDIAKAWGVTIIESDIEGKLPAIQSALHFLGNRAIEPVLILDADSRPVSKRWASLMRHATQTYPETPIIAGGLVCFNRNTDKLSGIAHSFKPVLKGILDRQPHIRGANMALNIANQPLLEQILTMPNYWPGEEGALVDLVKLAGGSVVQVYNPFASVVTDASRLTSIWTRFRCGSEYTHNYFVDSYIKDAPSSSISYWDIQDQ